LGQILVNGSSGLYYHPLQMKVVLFCVVQLFWFSDVELPCAAKMTGGIRAEKNRDADYYPEQLKD
jgi:hypothetical protein